MGILKKIEKAVNKNPLVKTLLGSSPAAPPGLAEMLSQENKQHSQHIHIHEHKKKKK